MVNALKFIFRHIIEFLYDIVTIIRKIWDVTEAIVYSFLVILSWPPQ